MTELTPPAALPVLEALELLSCGEITVEGRITSASNATLYCRIEAGSTVAACVYKPVAGERPLWDFPDGTLAEREVASYLVSAETGWELIPPTVLREGPLGTGMVQLWIAEDESFDVVSAINAGSLVALQRMALLDAVINNSDRKVSHLLPVTGSALHDPELHVFGVDHGVSFSPDFKLRTVLWQWAGDPIPDDGLQMLQRLADRLESGLGEDLRELLTTSEVRACTRRVRRLLAKQQFPTPPKDWPAIPYPPY